jgi:trehalose-phosphatase
VQHLFHAWAEFQKEVTKAPHVLLLCDYDGTLTPLVHDPFAAYLAPNVKEKLEALKKNPRFTPGIISGRELAEVKTLAGVEGIFYSGNHGLEVETPGGDYSGPAHSIWMAAAFSELTVRLQKALAGVPGAVVQDKSLSVSVHYRNAAPQDEPKIEALTRQTVDAWPDKRKVKICAQKKIWEIRPVSECDKGKAVLAIAAEVREKLKCDKLLTVFLGDDSTDEDAFKVLQRPAGWAIFVGDSAQKSAAPYYLASPAETEEFLTRLIRL